MSQAIHFLREMSGCVGGQPAPADQDRLAGLMRHNHELVMAASRMICQRLGAQPTCNPSMTGSMSAILLPEHASTMKREPCPIPGEAMLVKGNPSPETRLGFRTLDGMPATAHVHRFYHELLEEFGIEVPVYYWSGTGQVILRISAQAYNNLAQYERLADALTQLVARGK